MKCPQHPRYKGKGKPLCMCYPCWSIYVEANKNERFTPGDMKKMGASAIEFEGNRLMATGVWNTKLKETKP